MRLIDADLLNKKLNDDLCKKEKEKNKVACLVFETFIERLKEEKTIDAVPVVRCKDCRHYASGIEPGHGATVRCCKLHKGLVLITKDTFCSYGERKENEF